MNKTDRIGYLIMIVDILLKANPSKYLEPTDRLRSVVVDASEVLKGIEDLL